LNRAHRLVQTAMMGQAVFIRGHSQGVGVPWALKGAWSSYNDFNIVLGIPDGDVLDGALPARQMKLVQAWIELHRDDLMADWTLASSGQTPFKIDPLR
jgi:hypothetical protein